MMSLEPKQRVRRWHAYLVVWRLHRWLGLGLGIPLVLLSITGGLLVMHHDLERWTNPERHTVVPPSNSAERAPLLPILRDLQTKAPAGYRPLRVEPAHHATDSEKIVFVGPDRTSRWSAFTNPYTGEILWAGPDQSLLTPWLLGLHMHFRAGTVGYLVAALASVALTLLGLSGIWLNRDRMRALFRHPFRRRLGWRVALADLHKWVGIGTSYFTVVLGATGLWFSILIVPPILSGEKRAPLGPAFDLAQLAPVEPAIAAVRAQFPGAELARIIFPWDTGIKLQIRVLHREAPIWRKQSRMEFDPATGALLRVRDARNASTSEKWNSILGPLHFGYFGSPLVKWLYVVGGFAPAVLAGTGTAIWILRRRRERAANASSREPSRQNATNTQQSLS